MIHLADNLASLATWLAKLSAQHWRHGCVGNKALDTTQSEFSITTTYLFKARMVCHMQAQPFTIS